MKKLSQQPSLDANELAKASESTIDHYEGRAELFWEGTKDHDVAQNIDALLRHLPARTGSARILDFGCGPGRDLLAFRNLGFSAIGLDGSASFVRMARQHSGCEVLHQDFLSLDLPAQSFDGIFANATLFHIPHQEFPRVLGELRDALVERGVLFSSNPRGPNIEGWSGQRFCSYLDYDRYRETLERAGFAELGHYYRPAGLPREDQPWLASVWRRRE